MYYFCWMMICDSKIQERTNEFSVYQHEDNRSFVLDLSCRKITINFNDLLLLREQIAKLSEHHNLTEMIESGRLELVSMCNNEYFFTLNYSGVIQLQSLMKSIFQSQK